MPPSPPPSPSPSPGPQRATSAAAASCSFIPPTLPSQRGEGRVGDGKGQPVVIDYREMAPLAATRTMFRKDDTIYCARAVGVPGTVRGLALAHQRFGRLPWKDVVLPAVHLAEDGFVLDDCLASSLNWITAVSGDSSELRRVL